MPFDAARDRVLRLVADKLGVEVVALAECANRVIAAPFQARLDLPGFDQSAMDGYAVRCADLAIGAWLPVRGRSAAGQAPGRQDPGCAHRILTGAALPVGANAVVAQEDVYRQGDFLQIAEPPSCGINVRRRGEDIRAGQVLIAEGTVLDWRHVAVLAAQGAHAVLVRRRPRIVLLSSGRELLGPGERLSLGQVHDSNLPMLMALFQAWGAAVRPAPIVRDDPAAMRDALQAAAEGADLVVTSAGISVGDEDHVRDALRELGGSLSVLKVAMKPGKPLAAGRIGDAVFVGLPGNPMAALAGAVAFVRPVLARMTGTTVPETLPGHAGFDMRRAPGRTEFLPAQLNQRETRFWVERTGPDGSGRLMPLLTAGGFAFLPAETREIRHGEGIEFIPFTPVAIVSEPGRIDRQCDRRSRRETVAAHRA